MTRVSVVIPCHNHERFLGEAIESALAQSWPHVEVVVVDDGSTDRSAAVAAAHPVRLVRQRNHGLAAARNAGLHASTGEFLIFLDADDRLRPDAASEAVAALGRLPSAGMAIGRCVLIDEAGQPLATPLPRVTERFFEELLRHNYVWMPAMVAFPRRVFDRVGPFDSRVNASADYDMYLRIARRFDVATHDTIVAEYRRHSSNMSSNPVMMLDMTLTVMRRQRAFARQDRATWSAYREGMRHWRWFYGEQQVERFRTALRANGGRRRAAQCAFHLLRLYPLGFLGHVVRKARSGQWQIAAPGS